MSYPKTIHSINGVKMDPLQKTVNSIKHNPDKGSCSFHITNKWVKGGHNESSVADFYAGGERYTHESIFEMYADEPNMLGGNDQAANPVEHLLHAIASCVTTSMICHAAVRGIEIQELESEIEGDIDLRGFLGLDENVKKGYKNITVKFKVKTDEDDMDKLKKLSQFSPVFNSVSQGTPIDIQIEKE